MVLPTFVLVTKVGFPANADPIELETLDVEFGGRVLEVEGRTHPCARLRTSIFVPGLWTSICGVPVVALYEGRPLVSLQALRHNAGLFRRLLLIQSGT